MRRISGQRDRHCDGHRDRETLRRTLGQRDRHCDRHLDKEADTETDIWTERQTLRRTSGQRKSLRWTLGQTGDTEQCHLFLLYQQSMVFSVTIYGLGLTTMAKTNLLKLNAVQNEEMRTM